MLKDDELEKVSGGRLIDNWKEIIDENAEEYKRKEIDYTVFRNEIFSGKYNSLLICDHEGGFSKAEATEIEHYLESIRW